MSRPFFLKFLMPDPTMSEKKGTQRGEGGLQSKEQPAMADGEKERVRRDARCKLSSKLGGLDLLSKRG